MTAQTLTQIVERAQRGDTQSLSLLYERYAQDMAWLAYSIVLDRDLAEDIAQETFAQVCRKLGRLNRPEGFAAWLSVICRNLAIDALRRRKVRAVELLRDEATTASTQNSNGEIVHKAIARLPRMYREIVVMHYFRGMTYDELRQTLGISIHAVKGRLNRARKKMNHYLKDKELEL